MAENDNGESALDLNGAKHDVWLVKVPKYLATKWVNAPDGCPVGKLRIAKNAGRVEVTYAMDKSLESGADFSPQTPPQEHKFVLQGPGGQSLAVFSTSESPKIGEKRAMEGRVVQKVDCRPVVSKKYMQIKRTQMLEACKPKRTTVQLDSAVTTVYKPVNIHKEEKEFVEQKKQQGKKMRMEKDELQSKLFQAFEKHQYYNIKDLRDITQQPITFLKEVLSEMGVYSKHPGHRYMWELKPEYRHHKQEDDNSDSS